MLQEENIKLQEKVFELEKRVSDLEGLASVHDFKPEGGEI